MEAAKGGRNYNSCTIILFYYIAFHFNALALFSEIYIGTCMSSKNLKVNFCYSQLIYFEVIV